MDEKWIRAKAQRIMQAMRREMPEELRTDAPGEIDAQGSWWWAVTYPIAWEMAQLYFEARRMGA